MSDELTVEVVYAMPHLQRLKQITVPPGTTVQQAIERSGILQDFPEIDLTKNKVGVFGKLSRLDAPLNDRDRVEIYRPLIADPKEVRRRRAEAIGRRKSEG
ncbi:RnfH family protein [Pelomicrobium sp.]|uniref:RnfH family protein n=1 Tax=Pelomicrobium sp. TaxID=2815319 RepID=UPI002FDDF78D